MTALSLSGRGGSGSGSGSGSVRRGGRIGEAQAIGLEELARLAELAEVALEDVLDRRHVGLAVRAHVDEPSEVSRVRLPRRTCEIDC